MPPDAPISPAPSSAPLGRRALLRAMRSDPLRLWPDSAYEVMLLRQPFLTGSMLLMNAPEMVRHVLVTRNDIYGRSPASIRLLRPLAGNGLLLSEGETWQRQRRLIAPTLAPRALPTLLPPTTRATRSWLEAMAREALLPVDLLWSLQRLSLEIAAQSMFSISSAPFVAEIRAQLGSRAAIRLSRADLLDALLPAAIPAPRDLPRWWFRRRWMGLIARIIAARNAAPPAGAERDLFDLLRSATDPQGGAGKRQLRDEVATLIVAGHETTALTLFWSCLLLAGQPAMQERIAAEAACLDLDGTGIALAEALPRLAFTRAVVQEALRLYPPAAIIARMPGEDDQCCGETVPRGTLILIAPWVLHRHRAFWREPERFDPERFMPEAPPHDRFAYLPFGAGPRVCVGATFALAEAALALAALIRAFRISRADSAPISPVVFLTTHPNRSPLFHLAARRE